MRKVFMVIGTGNPKGFFIILWATFAAVLALVGCVGSESIEIPHIHGLGFSPDGRQLIVPAHDGLRVFADEAWSIPEAPAHDYMGYTPVDVGFYSSGHPHPSSSLVNPFGLVKSTDSGETLVKLGAAVTFHPDGKTALFGASQLLAYDLATEQTTELPSPTIAADDAIGYIAVNPVKPDEMALATFSRDIYLSLDSGQTWRQIAEDGKTK